MIETIIPATQAVPSICVFGRTPDSLRPSLIHVAILAWAIGPDYALPITPMGKAEPGGAWLVRDECGNFVCSDGTLLRDQHVATEWLRQRQLKVAS
jgi:hypothetical protein